MGDSSLRQVGADSLEGVLAMTPAWPNKNWPEDWLKRTLDQCRKEYSDEAWVGQELAFPWTLIPIMAEVLEQAASRNHETIRQVALKIDLHNVPATRAMVRQGIAFDETGRIAKRYQDLALIQWQSGVPRLIFPPDLAVAKPIWIGKK